MSNTEQDCAACELWINSLLSSAQKKVIDGPPVWHLSPPQREEYETPLAYALGMAEYANRVIAFRATI